jgi:alkylhydroperoxidase/carboxymuconolactone decarboxylase family protein YurZ
MTWSDEQRRIREDFIRVRGTWGPAWEGILELDPAFLEAYLNFSAVPWRKNHLDAKTKEFIYIAVDAAATHLYEPGIRQHVRAALGHGATPQELMEVIELTSVLGIHAMNVGVPILAELLDERGEPVVSELTTEQQRLKEDFVERRGFWNDMWEKILVLDPEIFEAYTAFSSVPFRTGTLDRKTKTLVYIAFDSAATHLYSAGTRMHMRNALDAGATKEEILEVLEIVSVLGIHAATVAVPILLDEVKTGTEGSGR